jgi:SAM-dependent methyltransferase
VDFDAFDTRGYRTVDVRSGYGAWVDTYEQTVEDAMDIELLERIESVDWSGEVADLGCGTGGSLAQAAPSVAGGLLAGLDLSAAALGRTAEAVGAAVAGMAEPPGLLCVQADLKTSLPLADGAFDRVLCHNVLEVLPDPDALVAEAIRVLRPGGRLVLAHSDFDTLIFASEDLELTRRLVRDYCDTQQPWMDAVDGTIGRRLADIAGRAGLVVEDVQAAVVLGRRFLPGEIGWGYARNLADTLRGDGRADPAELDRWLAGLQRLDDRGAFLFSVNDYAVICGRMPR